MRGCSSVMTKALYGRNYDYSPHRYAATLVAIRPKGVHASLAFSDRFTGRMDGMNEHGLCVDLHFVNYRHLNSCSSHSTTRDRPSSIMLIDPDRGHCIHSCVSRPKEPCLSVEGEARRWAAPCAKSPLLASVMVLLVL
jgi:hypothetical protein